MSQEKSPAQPARRLAFVFLGLMALALVPVLARHAGWLGLEDERRMLGVLVGIVMLVTGNLLPKLRPLRSPAGAPSRIHAAERLAGWTLVLAGLGYVGLFLALPLQHAGPMSSMLGIGAITVIAVRWLPLAWDRLLGPRARSADESGRVPADQRLTIWLLFGFFYVLASACVAFLLGDVPQKREIGAWMLVAYAFAAAAMQIVLEPRRRPDD